MGLSALSLRSPHSPPLVATAKPGAAHGAIAQARGLILITSLVLLGALTAPAVATPGGGNSANAKRCQHGGWEELQRADGTTFANQGAFVAYAAQGGPLEPRRPTITVSFLQGALGDTGCCGILVEVTGFAQDTFGLLITSEQEPDYPTLIKVGPDGTGSTRTIPPNLVGGTLWPEGDTVIATVAGLSSEPMVVSC